MPRYLVERTFPDGLQIPVDDVGQDLSSEWSTATPTTA